MSDSRSTSPASSEEEFLQDIRKPIDKNLPPLWPVTLKEWLSIWTRLNSSGNMQDRDIFALTGHFTDPGTSKRYRAQIDLSGCRPKPSDTLHQISDVDSAIGIMMRALPLQDQAIVRYYMVLSVSHTLKSDLHIPPVKVVIDDGPDRYMYLHKVPNTRLFELEPRGLMRIHFPHLADTNGSSVCLDEGLMRQLYDRIFRPAAEATLPEDLIREWPPTYDDEKWRGNKRKDKADNPGEEQRGGHTQQTGRDVHAPYIQGWMNKAREIIKEEADLSWARDFFLSFEMRGSKNRSDSMHPPPDEPLVDEDGTFDDEHPRAQAVKKLLEHFHTEEFEHGYWFLDLATRVAVSDDPQDPYACTFASVGEHAHLLSHFTGLDWELCDRYTSGHGGHYLLDQLAHLNDVAGGRLMVPRSQQEGVSFVQIYFTDKSVSYNVDLAYNAQRTSTRSMLLDWDRQLEAHIDPLIQVFERSERTHGVALRIESRVEYYHYPQYQLQIPDNVLQRCVYRLERDAFWGFKRARLISCRSVTAQWMRMRPNFTLRRLQEAGTLLIILAYMMNALVNRPDDGSNWNKVHDAACVHTMEGGVLVPVRPLGALFLPSLVFKKNHQPRVSSQRTLPRDRVRYFLGTRDELVNDLQAFTLITNPRASRKRQHGDIATTGDGEEVAAAAPRIGNKQRRVAIMSSEIPQNLFADLMPEPEGEEYSSEEEDPEERELAAPPGEDLSIAIYSYPIQIIAKAPNRSGNRGSWCSLNARQRTEIKFDFFSSLENLNTAFESHTLFPPDSHKWDRTLDALFPLVPLRIASNQAECDRFDEREKSAQGLSKLSVRQDFMTTQANMTMAQRTEMVTRIRNHVSRQWVWLPNIAAKGHLWAMGGGAGKSSTQVGGTPGGPWIILNPQLYDG